MNFAEPAVLFVALLAIPVLVLAWRSRAPLPRGQLRLLGVLQALAIGCAAVALAGPWSSVATGRGAMRALLDRAKLVAEPSGAITVAAVMEQAVQYASPVVLVLSGGNVEWDGLPAAMS